MTFGDPELLNPVITPFSRCRYCQAAIRLETVNGNLILDERKCLNCGIFLEEVDLFVGMVKDFTYTQAYLSAQRIVSSNLGVVPFVLVNLMSFGMGFPMWFKIIAGLLPYLAPGIICVGWFQKHYWSDYLSVEE